MLFELTQHLVPLSLALSPKGEREKYGKSCRYGRNA